VEDHSIQGIAVRVDRRLELVELLGGDASQLESDSYSHSVLSFDLTSDLRAV
jgi:hypothetical protein